MAKRSPYLRTRTRNRRVQRPVIDRLEPRKLLSATAAEIAAALDLPDGVTVSYTGHNDAVGVFENYTVHGILGMPSGPDGDFLVISTGNAYDAVRTTDTETRDRTTRMRDLGDEGAADDFATITFSIDVPPGVNSQRFLMDFLYASDMDTDGGDFFDVIINGVNIAEAHGARIEAGGEYLTNERDPDIGEKVAGYGIAIGTEYSDLLNIAYTIPDGVSTLEITITIADSNDAALDAWAMLDNVRFESSQVVYLDFDGQLMQDFFMTGMSYNIGAFDANDFGLGSDFADQIRADLEAIFSDFDIVFATDLPTEGDFMRVVVGGANRDEVTIADTNANQWLIREIGDDPTFREFFNYVNFRNENGDEESYGMADRIDLGNEVKNDSAVVFSEQISSDGFEYSHLLNTIAHYIGRNLGLRAESNAFTNSIMAEDIEIRGGEFEDADNTYLGEDWGDIDALGSTQNAHQVLLDNLGSAAGDVNLRNAWTDARQLNQAHWTAVKPTNRRLFDAHFVIIGDKHTRTQTTIANQWDDDQIVITDYAGQDPQIVVTATSREGGGRHNFETLGPRNLGLYTPVQDEALVSLIGLWESVSGGAFFQGALSLAQTQADDTTVYFQEYSFDDVDGDRVTIQLNSSTGVFAVNETDRGIVITLAETASIRDNLKIKVSRRGDGDGRVELGGVQGTGLKKLDGRDVDFVGFGIDLAHADQIKIGSMLEGADVNVRVDTGDSAKYDFETIVGDSNIVLGRKTSKLKVDRIDGAGLVFDNLSRLDVREDLVTTHVDIFNGSSATIKVKGNLLGGDWSMWNDEERGNVALKMLDVKGRVGDGATFTASKRIDRIKVKDSFEADLEAMSVDKFDVKGNWSGDFILTADGTQPGMAAKKISVKGVARNVFFTAGDKVKDIKLGAAHDSNFYIGFDESVVSGLPVDASLIENEDATVQNVKLTGVRDVEFDLVNTVFSAVEFKSLKLGDVDGDNDGTPFGVSAMDIKSIQFDTGGGRITNKNDDVFNDNNSGDDFFIGQIT